MGDSMDFEAVAEASDNLREVVRAMVAGLMDDGFTDREARTIVAGSFAGMMGAGS